MAMPKDKEMLCHSEKSRLQRFLANLREEKTGSALVYTALAMPVLIGAVGLSMDVGLWYMDKRSVQTIADSAAMAGALERRRLDTSATYALVEAAAQADAEANGLDLSDGYTLNVVWPYDGTNQKVEVEISHDADAYMTSAFFEQAFSIRARAVAKSVEGYDSCIFGLNPTEPDTIKVNGAAVVDLNCGIFSNSSYPDDGTTASFHQEGSGQVDATEIKVVGESNYQNVNPTPIDGINQTVDPLLGMPAPANPGTCGCTDNQNHTEPGGPGGGPGVGGGGPGGGGASSGDCFSTSGGHIHIDPGHYCGVNIRVTTSSTLVHFHPGTYIMDQGSSIDINGFAGGTEVMFYFTDSAPNIPFSLQAGSDVNFTAQTTGPYAGVLVYEDRGATAGHSYDFTGGANMYLEGIIYAPEGDVKFAGHAGGGATMILADTVQFAGDTTFANIGSSSIAQNKFLISATLVE
jgi:hypothetical protein